MARKNQMLCRCCLLALTMGTCSVPVSLTSSAAEPVTVNITVSGYDAKATTDSAEAPKKEAVPSESVSPQAPISMTLLSYQNLNSVSRQIATDCVGKAAGRKVVLLMDSDIASIQQYRLQKDIVSRLNQRDGKSPERTLKGMLDHLTGITKILEQASKIMQLFKTTTTYAHSAVVIDNDALESSLAAAFTSQSLPTSGFYSRRTLAIGSDSNALLFIPSTDKLFTQEDIDTALASKSAMDKESFQKAQESYEAAVADYLSSAYSKDENGVTAIARLNWAAQAISLIENGACVLRPKIVAMAGVSRTDTKNFTGNTSSRVNSGVLVSYMLSDKEGKTIAAGTVPYYQDYVKSQDITKLLRQE
jgi:hypothetical protein